MWSLFNLGAKRKEAAELEERILALQAELADCQSQAGQRKNLIRAGKAAVAVLLLVVGYAIGANNVAIKHNVGTVLGFAKADPVDAGDEAYQAGKYATAMKLLMPRAEEGDARAQALVGLMYYHGRGVKQDDPEAAKWFRLAADQGNARAQFNLGLMSAEGQGVPQDHAEANKWYQLAADQGDARAQFNLGVTYAEGHGVKQDYVEAYKWFNLAAPRFSQTELDRRRTAINNRDVTASRMSREQIEEAQRLAREWKPKSPEPAEINSTVSP